MPRSGRELQGKLQRLAGANLDRNQAAEQRRHAILIAEREWELRTSFCRRISRFAPITYADLPRLTGMHESPDFTGQDLLVYLGDRQNVVCTACSYDLRGLGQRGSCPECGQAFYSGADLITWDALAEAIGQELDMAPEQVQPRMFILASLRQRSAQLVNGEDRPLPDDGQERVG